MGGELAALPSDTLAALVLGGDLSKLNDTQRVAYYAHRCRAAGLDPGTKPFDIISLNGKLVLYATKECSAQLTARDKLSVEIVNAIQTDDIFQVTARATSSEGGRHTDDIGCVTIGHLTGDARCNAIMKATTKAKRRAVLSHCGLGLLDETELETIRPGNDSAAAQPPQRGVGKISDKQSRLLYAKWKEAQLDDNAVKGWLKQRFGIDHTRDLPASAMDEVLKWIANGGVEEPPTVYIA